VVERGGAGDKGADEAPRLLAVHRRAAPTPRRRRPDCRRSAWTAGARCATGGKPGSTSASETLDAGRKVGRGDDGIVVNAIRSSARKPLLGVRSCSLCRFGLELPHHLGTWPAAAPKRCITG